ncbi:MAG: flagellar hook protein FlgE [Vicinamibacterales bacterium]
MGFSSSLSGLNVNQQKLNVIGNNLANINTIGFKASTVQFMDLVSQSVGGSSANPMQVGLGVMTGSISPSFKQGGIENTGVPTNVAIQGNGFFVVGDASNRSYTRAGDFSFDADGMLVTADGLPVQGFTASDPVTGAIITTGQASNIVVPPGVLRAPTATTSFGTVSNLNSGAAVAAEFTASVQVYDALGSPHVATITYTNTGAGAWDYEITVPGEEITAGVPGTPSVIATGDLTFDANGQLDLVNGAAAADVAIVGPAWANGAAATAFTWDLVDANGVASLTGFAGPSATSSVTQNGAAAGTINSISINSTGEILATFGTGSSVSVGQLAMANFNNPQGLVKLGSNRYGESASAGIPNVGVAGTGGRGSLIGSSLEQSNVDIAQEFTQMILAQRGYQANSKSITVADELLVETLNLKR